jgi:hypothetical protein
MEVLPWGGARERDPVCQLATGFLEGEEEREEREVWLSHNSF